jgi:NAD(P)-dependent dehydrogenase (short-subunit alcohol dehydrogenase family)
MEASYNFSGKSAVVIGGTTGIGREPVCRGSGRERRQGPARGDHEAVPKVQAKFAELDVRDAKAMKAFHDEAFKRFDELISRSTTLACPAKQRRSRIRTKTTSTRSSTPISKAFRRP